MPYTYYTTYVCKCGKTYSSRHYKEPEGCPTCRAKKHNRQVLQRHYDLAAMGKTHHKGRDSSYDGNQLGAPPSVYASTCVIHLKYEHAACWGCGNVRDLINDYCDLCRGNGANEAQCANANRIK